MAKKNRKHRVLLMPTACLQINGKTLQAHEPAERFSQHTRRLEEVLDTGRNFAPTLPLPLLKLDMMTTRLALSDDQDPQEVLNLLFTKFKGFITIFEENFNGSNGYDEADDELLCAARSLYDMVKNLPAANEYPRNSTTCISKAASLVVQTLFLDAGPAARW